MAAVRGDRHAAPVGGLTPRVFLRVAIAALGLLALGAYSLSRRVEVVAHGRLLESTSLEVNEVRLLGRYTLYAAEETSITFDHLNAGVLFAIATIALFVAVFLDVAVASVRPRVHWFFLGAWLGAGYLAADELFSFHETLGFNLEFLADLPGVDHADDVILAAYLLPASAFVVAFRDVIASSRHALRLFVLGLVLFVVAVVLDVAAVEVEDLVEGVGSLCLLAGFMALGIRHVAASTGLDRAP